MSSSRSSRSGSGGARLASCRNQHHYPPSSYSYHYSSSPSSAFASSTTASFGSSRSTSYSAFHHHHHHHHHHQPQPQHHHHLHGHAYHRSVSPTRVNFVGSAHTAAPSVRFSIDPRSISPGRSLSSNQISVHHQHHHHHHHHSHHHHHPHQRRLCMCSPTTHPGSFRCSLHKNIGGYTSGVARGIPSPNHLNERRSAMTNSLVRIGTVEGELVRRALTALIRPSSHQQRRKAAFQPRPSRLSIMSKASDGDDDAISLC